MAVVLKGVGWVGAHDEGGGVSPGSASGGRGLHHLKWARGGEINTPATNAASSGMYTVMQLRTKLEQQVAGRLW